MPADQKLIDKIRRIAAALATKDTRILALYLLGSVARGEQRPDSDIDIGLMPEPGQHISALERVQLANSMAVELKRSVDLGEISSKNLVYSFEALMKGTALYKRDSDRADLYGANLLGMYQQFNYERREVLDAYRA